MSEVNIRKVNSNEKEVLDKIVTIHLDTFKGFFLTFMGYGFLRQMYSSYCSFEKADLLVAENTDGQPLGFLSYAEDMSGLYKFMIKKKLIAFAFYSIGAFFRKPKVFMRLVRAFLKPSETKRDEKYVELSSIGVSPDAKSKGVGSLLIDKLKSIVDFDKFEYITLETDTVDNVAANNFYLKNGFVKVREFQTREGRKMNEYRFYGKEQ